MDTELYFILTLLMQQPLYGMLHFYIPTLKYLILAKIHISALTLFDANLFIILVHKRQFFEMLIIQGHMKFKRNLNSSSLKK